MKCPRCGHPEDKVVESRPTSDNVVIRRRRECEKCGARFTSYERIEEQPLTVIKKDSRREPFDRKKIIGGIQRACEKRPISVETIDAIVNEIEAKLEKLGRPEVESTKIGEMVMDKLEKLDHIAYVRFASVYREFRDVKEFVKTVRAIGE